MKKIRLAYILAGVLIASAFGSGVYAQDADGRIEYLKKSGYVSGYEDESLNLDRSITRAEMTKLLVMADGWKNASERNKDSRGIFTDVKPGFWANGYINLASEKGSNGKSVISGYNDNTFKPEGNITFEEFAKMLIVSSGDRVSSEDIERINDRWPDNCVEMANRIGIFKNVNYVRGKSINRMDAFSMLFNALSFNREKGLNESQADIERYKLNEKVIEELKNENRDYEERISENRDTIRKSRSEINNLRDEISTLKKDRTVEELKSEIENLKKENATLKDSKDKLANDEKIKELQAQLESLKKNNKELEDRLNAGNINQDSSIKVPAGPSGKPVEDPVVSEDYQQQESSSNGKLIEMLKKEAENAKKQAEDAKKESDVNLKEVNTQLEQQVAELERVKKQVKDFEEANAELQRQFDEANKKLNNQTCPEPNYSEKDEVIEKLQKENDALNIKIRQLQAELEKLKESDKKDEGTQTEDNTGSSNDEGKTEDIEYSDEELLQEIYNSGVNSKCVLEQFINKFEKRLIDNVNSQVPIEERYGENYERDILMCKVLDVDDFIECFNWVLRNTYEENDRIEDLIVKVDRLYYQTRMNNCN